MDDLSVDLLNFTLMKDIGAVRAMTGGKVTLLGNIPPMSLVKNTPDEVYALAKGCIDKYVAVNGSARGLILSIGGGMPMGAKGECIDAIIKAAKEMSSPAV